MRIGIDYRPVTVAPDSGIGKQVLALERAISGFSGVELVRFTAAPHGHAHRETACCPAGDSPLHGLHRPHERLKFEQIFLPQAIRQQRLDVYIATANMGLPIVRAPRDTVYVQVLHDIFQISMDNRHANKIRALVYRWLDYRSIASSLAVAKRIWTPSIFTAQQAAERFPRHADRIRVLPNAVDLPDYVMVDGHEKGYWLLVGTREPRKNVPWFIEQWWRVKQDIPDRIPPLVLVGMAEDVPEHLRQLPGLRFTSSIHAQQLANLYAHAARLWQPSLAEGFGLPVVEAMAYGTPVAVARGSALDEVAPEDAVRFDPRDERALQRLMSNLGCERLPGEEAEKLREWSAQYRMPHYARRLAELLTDVTGQAL